MSSRNTTKPRFNPADLDLSDARTLRWVCHVLVERLPENGLGELLETLTDMEEFHKVPVPASEPLQTSPPMPVRITGSYIVPSYPASEE